MGAMSGIRTTALAVLLGSLLAGCAQTPPPVVEKGTDFEDAATRRLERTRDASRNDPAVRSALASEYYRVARRAMDAGDQAQYRDYLRKAQDELVAALRIDPGDPGPHNQMGIILAYQGELDAAHASFANSLRLLHRRIPRGSTSDGLHYTNLAHIDVYRGNLEEARRNLEIGRRRGAPVDEIDRIETLLAWRTGGRLGAREVFAAAAARTPAFTETWDSVPLPKKMVTFDDFCVACCRNPSCGPHMEDACLAEGQGVKQREITRETLVEEMRLERERRAKLKEIYERERSLSIEIEPDSRPAPPPEPSAKPKPAP